MKFFLSLFAVSFCTYPRGFAHVKKNLGLSVEVSSLEAQQFLKSHPEYRLISALKLTEFSDPEGEKKVNQAQLEFLEGSLEKAQNLFLNIVKRRFDRNWDMAQRQRVLYSLLRLAQMESDHSKQAHWLEEAVSFDKTYSPDRRAFPPPLVEKLSSIKQNQSTKVFRLPESVTSSTSIFVNGRKGNFVDGLIQLLPGIYRFTFIDPYFEQESIVISAKELEKLKLKQIRFASGDCYNPQPEMAKSIHGILYSGNCIKTRNHQSKPLFVPQKIITKPVPTIEKKKKSFWSKNKFWIIAGGVVASGITAWQLSQGEDGTSPTGVASPTSTGPTLVYGGRLSGRE